MISFLAQTQASPTATAAATQGYQPLVVLVIYLLVLMGLAVVGFLRSRGSEEDYYLAGRGQGWCVSSLTIMATFFSSFALLGAPAFVYKHGVVFALFALNVPVAGACVWLFGSRFSKLGRAFGYVTPADMASDYYSSEWLRGLVTLAGVCYVVPYIVAQMQAGGVMFNALLPAPLFDSIGNFEVGCILLAIITCAYIMVGGMRSVAWSDVLQGLLLITGMFLGGYVVIEVLGGFSSFTQKINELPQSLRTAPGPQLEWTPLMLMTTVLFAASGSMVSAPQWMRFYSADSVKSLRRSALIFAIVLTSCYFFGVMLVGLAGQIIYPSEFNAAGHVVIPASVGHPDQILVRLLDEKLREVMPLAGVWISSVIVMAIAAASMSTADSNLHALSAVFTRDVYRRYFRRNATEQQGTTVGRWVILIATAVAVVLVISAHNSEQSLLGRSFKTIVGAALVGMSFSAQLLPIAADMIWVRRGGRWGATLGLLAGIVMVVIMNSVSPQNTLTIGGSEFRMMGGAWGLVVNVPIFVIVSCFEKRPARSAAFAKVLSPSSASAPPPR